jgi:transketolase
VIETSIECADRARRLVVEAALSSGGCHIGSSLSVVDLLSVLYDGVLGDDDRFLLSKGHAAAGFYAVLACAGHLPEDEVAQSYCGDGSRLAGHPERGAAPGVELTAGSLGHGLSVALGLALGAPGRTFCLLGDGELNEGSVWEALALAGHLGVPGLVCIVDANGLQGLGETFDVLDLEPLPEKLRAFGWDVAEADGHDHDALRAALAPCRPRPFALVARTVKGYGLDFFENDLMSHYRSLRPDDRERALASLARSRA